MFKNLYKPLISGFIVLLLISACAPVAMQEDRLKALEDSVSSISNQQSQLSALQADVSTIKAEQENVSSIQSEMEMLSTQVATLEAGSSMEMGTAMPAPAGSMAAAEDPFELSVAQFVLDTAGFHGMAETISADKKIDPAYLSPVNRAYKVLSQTTWPEPLAEQGHAFVAMLKDFSEALAADNVDGAVTLSDQVHEAQHELSAAIDAWATDANSTNSADDPFALSVAQFVLDTAGFHGMAESINTDKKIDPAYLSPVNRVYKVLSHTVWPESLAEQGQAFVALLKDFSAALAADNLEDAITLSDQVHDAQHELSSAIDDWLSQAAVDAHAH